MTDQPIHQSKQPLLSSSYPIPSLPNILLIPASKPPISAPASPPHLPYTPPPQSSPANPAAPP